MNTNDYIKELKSHLSNLDKKRKDEIIKEIESYIAESEVSYSLLVERFGEAKDLANSYLEEEPENNNKGETVYKKTKRVFITVFVFLALVFIAIALFIYFMTRDPFNYEEFDANSVSKNLDTPWMQIKDISKLDVSQSKLVIYWSKDNITRLSCKKDEDKKVNKNQIKDDTLFIQQSNCYLVLSDKKTDIKTYQSKVVLIEPTNEINLDTEQSSIELAKKSSKYKLLINKKQSEIKDNLSSNENGIIIKGSLYQSSLKAYEY